MLLLLLLTTAAGVRVGYLVHYARDVISDGPLQVQENTVPDDLIQNLKEQRCFAGARKSRCRPAWKARRTCARLSLARRRAGPVALLDTDAAVLVRRVQCGLGSLTVAFYFLFARWPLPAAASRCWRASSVPCIRSGSSTRRP